MIRRPPRSTLERSSAASDVYKRQALVFTRADALVEIRRGGRETYRILPSGDIANQQRIRFTSQLDETQRFDVVVDGANGATLVLSESPIIVAAERVVTCLLYTSPSPRDRTRSRMPSSA